MNSPGRPKNTIMTTPAAHNPTGRFTGLAELYARCRPGYPESAIDFIVSQCHLGPGSVLVDVGCGTGISARIMAHRGVPVVGIEPNADMRAQAEAEVLPPPFPQPIYRDGKAEATGLPDRHADAVLSAQAFHWFEREAALREFHRVLKPGGWVVLMWNERDESDLFTAAYGEVIRTSVDAAMLESTRARAGEILLMCPLFQHTSKASFTNVQELDEEGVVGRAFSVSYAPKDPAAAEQYATRLRQVFSHFQHGGRAMLRYVTTVYVGQRQTDG